EALHIPEPLWRFSLVEAMIRDMSMGDAKLTGTFVDVHDDANELVINVSLENDHIADEALHIPEPLWRFSLVEAMIRDMSMGDAKLTGT
ncbi:hypothetical protein CQA81_31215, partial [Klebsiella pneumoniae]